MRLRILLEGSFVFCVLPAPNTLRKDALWPIRTRTLLETASKTYNNAG